ncbi:MAG: DUF3320 domain-containing protein [Candidatus Marinimicrobia bacterium]|nr:DUF3320 domain-containing protein [Candidatus Neomarinimicrobiota bacterium]MDA1364039.1 DUF3320 domain-containing protein [Candidatus Neomarinimicrobiota bacterium]
MDDKILNKLSQWQNKLLDTSRRNPLINFKPYKRTTVKIVDEKPTEVFRQLVVNMEKFTFGAQEKPKEDNVQVVEEVSTEFDVYSEEDLEDKHTDSTLQTNLEKQNLFNNLRAIQYKAQDIIEEQGYNNLFLTLGMLEWYDVEHSDKKNRSPLILVPVKISKKSIKGSYQIERTDEDPIINLSLQEKLATNFNLELPEIVDSEDFDPIDYFNQINKIITKNDRWAIKEDINLGFFSFANFVMFKDLDRFKSMYGASEIIQSLSGLISDLTDRPLPEYIGADELDIKRKPHDTYQVLDADSSQQEAIEIVKSGTNLVIQGPPGTGKSQTIVNLITEMLAANKKVLFVCEKMAALDVVYERLKTVGLDRFCLQIHSRKANKKDTLMQLKDAYDFQLDKVPSTKYLDELVEYRQKLNDYTTVLHQEIKSIGQSLYWLIGQLNTLKDVPLLDGDLGGQFKTLELESFNKAVGNLETLKERISQIGLPIAHNFWGTEIDSTSEQHQQSLKQILEPINDLLESMLESIGAVNDVLHVNIQSIDHIEKYDALLKHFDVPHTLNNKMLSIKDVSAYQSEIRADLDILASYQDKYQMLSSKYDSDIFEEFNAKSARRLLKGDLSSFFRFFKGKYYSLKNEIKGFQLQNESLSYDSMLSLCDELIDCQKLQKKITNFSEDSFKPLGEYWQQTTSDIEGIKGALDWLSTYQSLRVDIEDDVRFKEYLLSKKSFNSTEKDLLNFLVSDVKQLKELKSEMDELLLSNDEVLYRNGFVNESLSDFSIRTTNWINAIGELVDWTRFRRVCNQCEEVGLSSYLDDIIATDFDVDLMVSQFKKKFFYLVFESVKKEHPVINEFESLTHDKVLANFKKADKLQMDIAIERVKNKICINKPDKNYKGSKSSQLGILQKQFKLQRGQMALRKLFIKAPNAVQDISPCFMMSPMSVAQYIDPQEMQFDLVIFDEASQIKPEHSVGAIIRGKQLVVTGDDKQLPPTSFFQKMELNEEEDDDEVMLDSILDECSVMPTFTQAELRWHYRSRDESLIQFSNINFYNNKLFTFPTRLKDTNELGVELHYHPDSLYDRGGSASNRQEAKVLLEHVIAQLKKDPSKSIGVVALSQSQQSALRQEKDAILAKQPELQALFEGENIQTRFFIKNLETVQGDERDIIYISVGYGKNKNNTLPMNFGPINKEGGERRLNVLISRAKEKVNIFSSIKGSDFDLTRTQSVGVRLLKEYLDYAESGGDITTIQNALDVSNSFDEDNPFESSVYQQLKLAGIDCVPQVGQSGYKIDFGIVDPNDKSKFILALECDGAAYHSSATARDRDRLRQSVLENLGWKFHRIWSTDWFANPQREMKKLKESIKSAQTLGAPLQSEKIDLTELEFDEVEIDDTQGHGITIKDYDIYDDTEYYYGFQDEFYYLAKNSYEDDTLPKLISKIIEQESPIHIRQLALRVIEQFGMTRVGSKIMDIIEYEVDIMKTVTVKNDFVYLKKQQIDFIRKRVDTDMDDNILLISPEEIQNAIKIVLTKEFAIPKNELIVQIARILGYLHTGPRIQEYLSELIDSIEGKFIELEDNEYRLKQ